MYFYSFDNRIFILLLISNQVKDETIKHKETDVEENQTMEVDQPETSESVNERDMEVDTPEPVKDSNVTVFDDTKSVEEAKDEKAIPAETQRCETVDEKDFEPVLQSESEELEIKSESSVVDEKTSDKLVTDPSAMSVKKESTPNSAMESVDKLKAMFPELEVMHKGTDLDTNTAGYPMDKQNKVQLEKTFAQLIAHSYQHPVRWPKVRKSQL